MTYRIVVQRIVSDQSIPSSSKLKNWAKITLQKYVANAEVTIRIVGQEEIMLLNSTYRDKNKPTNVLSFPADLPPGLQIMPPFIGDIVICADIIFAEAKAQNKPLDAHWAHMVVHGLLHLLGYDHEITSEAEQMEAEEIVILNELGFNNPYQLIDDNKGEST